MEKLSCTYAGLVEATDDPERIGRLKVRVPAVYGAADTKDNSITTADLPWALPAGLPAGGSPQSGAIQWLPAVGDSVFVRFLDGLPEQPIWEWGSQSRPQAKAFPYWTRDGGGYTDDGPPESALLTRYGHSMQFSPGTLLLATSRGYALVLTDAKDDVNGLITLITAKGYKLEFSDSDNRLTAYVPELIGLIQTIIMQGANQTYIASDTHAISAGTSTLEAADITRNSTTKIGDTATEKIFANAPFVSLGSENASDAVVRLSDLRAAVQSIMTQFNSHLHLGNLGRPTSPPIVPMTVVPKGSTISFSA